MDVVGFHFDPLYGVAVVEREDDSQATSCEFILQFEKVILIKLSRQ